MFPTASVATRVFTSGDEVPQELANVIRDDLTTSGFCVVKLYDENDETVMHYEAGMDGLAKRLRPDGGTANGGRGMGGITKPFGAGCEPIAAEVRLDPRARAVHAAIYGLSSQEVMSGWDAVGILGTDAVRKRTTEARLTQEDAKKAYFEASGGSLQPHVDVSPILTSPGSKMEAKMKTLHPVFPCCVQSQFVCRSVPAGGATLVVAPGQYVHETPNASHFVATQRDFSVCTDEGYMHYRGQWRAVEGIPRGCLILWLSRTPHGNKLADVGVDPQRRVVYISWQSRALVSDEERRALRVRKLDAVYSGATTDHWSTQAPKLHRGSHYSNGKGLTKVLYDRDRRPSYSEGLASRIEDAF